MQSTAPSPAIRTLPLFFGSLGLVLGLAAAPGAAKPAPDDEAPSAAPEQDAYSAPGRAARRPLESLRRFVPWAYPDMVPVAYGPPDAPTGSPATGPRGPLVGPSGVADPSGELARLGSRPERASSEGGLVRLTPNEALGVRVAAGLEPPTVQRGSLSASAIGAVGFAPMPYAVPSFPELPGGIVFGLPLHVPEDLAPRSVRWTSAGHLAIETAGEQLHFSPDSARDLLACLRQALATRGSDAMVSITRSGRVQLSEPFLRAPAGRALALADLAPFNHLPNAPGSKSLILDRHARLERGPDGALMPLVDLELRFYADRGGEEPEPGDLRQTLFFEALAVGPQNSGPRASGLYFRGMEPAWGRAPWPGALEGLAQDLAPAARLAAWTAVFRWLDEAGAEGLEALERDLSVAADREAHDANRHLVPRLR
jgi:hypothetical protein